MLCVAASAQAGGVRYEPVPHSPAQAVQSVNGAAIISESGQGMDAGASMAPASADQVWLSVSVKNKSPTSVAFADDAIRVLADGGDLPTRSAEEAIKLAKDDGYERDRCANATASSQVNCTIDWFTQRQQKRMEKKTEAEQAAQRHQLAPGELLARQFQVDLPRKPRAGAVFKVVVTIAGEQLSFDFRRSK
jgi:hypothetical protein